MVGGEGLPTYDRGERVELTVLDTLGGVVEVTCEEWRARMATYRLHLGVRGQAKARNTNRKEQEVIHVGEEKRRAREPKPAGHVGHIIPPRKAPSIMTE